MSSKTILKEIWAAVSVALVLIAIYLAPGNKWLLRLLLFYLFIVSNLNQSKLDKIRKDLSNQASIIAGWIRMKPPKNIELN
jgi:hypothetical protein